MGQFKYVYELIATLLENIDGGEDIAQMLGYTKENEEVMLNTINTRYLKAKANMHVERNYPLEGMENKVPKLFIHGGADTFVPTANVYTLYKEAKGYKEILVVPKAGHGQSIFVDPILPNTGTLNKYLLYYRKMKIKIILDIIFVFHNL